MSPAVRVIVVQAGIGAISAAIFFIISPAAGTSAALAGCCVLLPTLYYVWVQARTFEAARILLHGVLKMALTVALLVICIAVIGIEPLAFFLTFALMQLSYLVSGSRRTVTNGGTGEHGENGTH